MIYFEGGDFYWFDIGTVIEELTGSSPRFGQGQNVLSLVQMARKEE